MPIVNLFPVAHPAQPAVVLDLLAIEEFRIINGSAINTPAGIEVVLKPYAELETSAGEPAWIDGPVSNQTLRVDDAYKYAADSYAEGDEDPAALMDLLVRVVNKLYQRRNAPQS